MTDQIAFFGFLLTRTITVVGGLVWLNKQFSTVREDLSQRLPFQAYEIKHEALSNRVRNIELWIAKNDRSKD